MFIKRILFWTGWTCLTVVTAWSLWDALTSGVWSANDLLDVGWVVLAFFGLITSHSASHELKAAYKHDKTERDQFKKDLALLMRNGLNEMRAERERIVGALEQVVVEDEELINGR